MKKKKPAKSAAEFDRRFEAGEDVHDIVDLSKARITRPGKRSALPWISRKLSCAT